MKDAADRATCSDASWDAMPKYTVDTESILSTPIPNPMSEIKQINTGVAELLAVKVTEGAVIRHFIYPHVIVFMINGAVSSISLPSEWHDGKWTPLGLDTELTEEQCRELIPNYGGKLFDYDPNVYNSYPDYKFKDHPFESKFFNTAKESFYSLMETNGLYSKNPNTHPIYMGTMGDKAYEDLEIRHEEAEANTGTWLILKRLS